MMLTILYSSNTGMQARQMLERKPPTCTSTLSSTNSFSTLRRPTSGLDSSSATISSIGRPLMPPDLLMRSTAICTPTSAVLPPAAPAPDSGCSVPILYGLACPKAACHGAGTSMLAPSAPAAAEPYPINRRRVTLPRYQNVSPQSCVFASSVIVGSSQAGCNGADTRHDNCRCPSAQRVAGNPYRSRLSKPGPASREPVFCPPPDDKIGNRRWQFGPRPREERHVGSQHVSQAV